MHIKILHHGRCFDGAVSAALLIRLLRAQDAAVTFDTEGLTHQVGSPYSADSFAAEHNAVVDFRYSPDPRLTWWFDHHHSAFLSSRDRDHFAQHPSVRKHFDPHTPSCAGLIHRVARDRFGLDLALEDPDLVTWADTIDAAAFASPAVAVRLAEPELQLMTWLESASEPHGEARLIAHLADGTPIQSLITRDWIASGLGPALEAHHRTVALVRTRMVVRDRVAWVDLSGHEIHGLNKFIVYEADPTLLYSVVLLQQPQKIKISVGSNPWRQPERQHDIAHLCEQMGGGGHPAVGGIVLSPQDLRSARARAAQIVTTLRGDPRPDAMP